MRNSVLVALVLSVAAPALAAPPGTAQNFLDRANRLKAKGPLAFFDRDYGRLKAEATAVTRSRMTITRNGWPPARLTAQMAMYSNTPVRRILALTLRKQLLIDWPRLAGDDRDSRCDVLR